MPISNKPASGTYTINTSATWCPDTLWMCDEGSGTSLNDVGKSAGTYNNDGTLAAVGTGSTPTWGSDSAGAYIDINASGALTTNNGGKVYSANLCSFSTNYSAVIVARIPTISSNSGAAVCVGDKDYSFVYDAVIVDSGTTKPYANQLGGLGSSAGDTDDNAYHLIGIKRKNGELAISVDGGAWVVKTGTDTNGWPNYGGYARVDQLTVGALGVSGSTQNCLSVDLLAMGFYKDVELSDANISTIWNSGDVWASFGVGNSGINSKASFYRMLRNA